MSRLAEDRLLFWVSLAAFTACLLIASAVHAEENDVAIALRTAREYELSPFQTQALLCVRVIENGRPGRDYGILHPHALGRGQLTQARWAAGTVRKRLPDRAALASFARRWAPMGAANDPHDLNRHWLSNMETCLTQLSP